MLVGGAGWEASRRALWRRRWREGRMGQGLAGGLGWRKRRNRGAGRDVAWNRAVGG